MPQLEFLKEHESLQLLIIFGSAASDSLKPDSDVDVAFYAEPPLDCDQLQELANQITVATDRPVDLVDLSKTHGVILRQILHHGKVLFCRDSSVLANLTCRLLAWQEDFEPALNAMLQARIKRLIQS